MSKRMLVFMTVFSLCLIIISLYFIKTLDPGAKPKPVSEVINVTSMNIKITDPFKLTFSDNSDFDLASLKGKFTLIYFGFAQCPDICPATLLKIKDSIDSLTVADLDKIQFIFISIDPERDSASDLNNFIKQFGNNIKAASGEKVELDKLASSLKVYYAKSLDKFANMDNDYYVDHSSFIYLLNPDAELISQFTPNASSADITKEVKDKLLNKNV